MNRVRPPRLHAEHALGLILQIAGSSKPAIVFGAIALTVTLGWFADATWDLLTHLPLIGKKEAFPWLVDTFGMVVFPALVLGVWSWARKARHLIRVNAIQDLKPPQVKALILCLSPMGKDSQLVSDICEAKITGSMDESGVLSRFQGPWRMPLEAIAYHVERLTEVIVIASADQARPRPVPGTFSEVDRFIQVVNNLLPLHGRSSVQVRSISQCVTAIGVGTVTDYAKGVDFEDVKALVSAIEDAWEFLISENIPSYEILVDVTGGQKPSTVAGATVALAEGRRFQYVSTLDYRVRTYDITYLA